MMKLKVLIIINDGNFFLLHWGLLTKFLQKNGYEIHVACPDSVATPRIISEGFFFHPILLSRHGLNPLAEVQLILQLKHLYEQVQPDIIHNFGIKPIIYGTISASFYKKARVINAPTGLGYVFSSATFKAKILKRIVIQLYQWALQSFPNYLIFQNDDDRHLFNQLGLLGNNKTAIIKGTGLDLTTYQPKPEVQGEPIIILPARLIWEKGIKEFIEAALLSKKQGIAARFALVGDIDINSKDSVKKEQLMAWINAGTIEWWGWQNNMAEIFQSVHIVCLPSYREGIPTVLLEAAACAKPIVTTNVPGCKEVVIDQLNGFIAPTKDSQKLAEALIKLVNNADLRQKMGALGRERVKAEFSAERITQEMLNVYHELLANR